MDDEPRLPLAADGFPSIAAVLGAAAGCLLLACILGASGVATVVGGLGIVLLALGLFLVNFFRDPRREPPPGDANLVSPADGKVIIAESEVEEPRFLGGRAAMVSIFMSPLDVHVNRAPVDGEVAEVRYHPGRYFAAWSEKASLDNEQNAVVLAMAGGRRVAFVQIAGFLARRIVCRVRPGDRVRRGQRVGMIKLGSRVDIFVPGRFDLKVKVGDRVRAGETVLGVLG